MASSAFRLQLLQSSSLACNACSKVPPTFSSIARTAADKNKYVTPLGYGAKTTIFKTTGPWDTDAVGITDFVDDAGPIAGPDNEPQRWHMMRTRHVWGPVRHLQNGWRMLRGR